RLDGMELLRRIRAEQPEVAIVVLTAHGSVATAVEAMKLGAIDYLEKTLESPAALRMVVARLLSQARLRAHVAALTKAVGTVWPVAGMIGACPAMQRVFEHIGRFAEAEATVLIQGESGTGKELVARAIHDRSRRCGGPLVTVNCAAHTKGP